MFSPRAGLTDVLLKCFPRLQGWRVFCKVFFPCAGLAGVLLCCHGPPGCRPPDKRGQLCTSQGTSRLGWGYRSRQHPAFYLRGNVMRSKARRTCINLLVCLGLYLLDIICVFGQKKKKKIYQSSFVVMIFKGPDSLSGTVGRQRDEIHCCDGSRQV